MRSSDSRQSFEIFSLPLLILFHTVHGGPFLGATTSNAITAITATPSMVAPFFGGHNVECNYCYSFHGGMVAPYTM